MRERHIAGSDYEMKSCRERDLFQGGVFGDGEGCRSGDEKKNKI
jgi:hypothetical protein